MQATIEAALAHHVRNVAIIHHMVPGFFYAAAKKERSHNRCSHDFRIADAPLWVFRMVLGFQHIVTKAKYSYNLGVHAILRFRLGLLTTNFTRFRMDFIFSPQGGN